MSIPKRYKKTDLGNFLRAEFGIPSDYIAKFELGGSSPHKFKDGRKKQMRIGRNWFRAFFPAYRARSKFTPKEQRAINRTDLEYFYEQKAAVNRDMGRADSDPRERRCA